MLIDIAKVAKPNHLSRVLIKDKILPDMHLIQKQDDILFMLWTEVRLAAFTTSLENPAPALT